MASAAFAQAPTPPAPTTAQEWFDGKDVNEDGFLVLEEVPGTRTEGNFEMFDTDKDGKLSFEEYRIGREATEGAAGGMGGGMGA